MELIINSFSIHSRIGRRSFLSLGAAGAASLLGCSSQTLSDTTTNFNGDVLIIGAGPAGMTAAHLLQQRGANVQVLEAASSAGGRIKHDLEFTDFPISLGGEWVHVDPMVLQEIVNDSEVDITTQLRGYDSTSQSGYFDGNSLELFPNSDSETDSKFVGSSWLDFFSTYILPGISSSIIYNSQVVAIDYSGERIQVTDVMGVVRTADKVIVTAPIKILQRGDIEFRPALPENKRETINDANVWSGFKAFIEFDHRFYPAYLSFPDSETNDGQRLYYDAAYGQESATSILGLFAVGAQAERYQAFSNPDVLQLMLSELDEIFDGVATRSYRRHIVQNWNDDPYAGAAYLADVEASRTSRVLSESVANRIYFAGEAYTSFDDWGGVHTATRSAAEAVNELLR